MTAQTPIWPNFFIAGAAKCGTTALYAVLKKHPQVFLPEMKETNYFASAPPPPEVNEIDCAGDFAGYQRLYQGAEGFAAVGDSSPSYLWNEGAAERIHNVSPQAKIVIILRDPVVRAHSAYLMNLRSGAEPKSATFWEALQRDAARREKGWWIARLYVELGLYHDQVRRYLNVFGRKQTHILLFDDLKNDPAAAYRGIAQHLGIAPDGFRLDELSELHNAYRMPRSLAVYRLLTGSVSRQLRHKLLPASVQDWLRHSPLLYGSRKPSLDDESRRYLQEIFDPDINSLEELLGRKLPELRKSWV